MTKKWMALLVVVVALLTTMGRAQQLRPPSVPLIAVDPYFSVWSPHDRLTDGPTTHWTGHEQPLSSLVRIDGTAYRLMGSEPSSAPALAQTGLQVTPTRTTYEFEGGGEHLTLTFMTPLLQSDLDVLARPVTYLTWTAHATDGQPHAVSVYFDAGSELAVNTSNQAVMWSRAKFGPVTALKIGTQEQPILAKAGDNLRIDWGYLYVAPLPGQPARLALAAGDACRSAFAQNGTLPLDDARQPRPVSDAQPVAAVSFDLGAVGDRPAARTLMVAYDDIYGIQYFKQNLRSWWRRKGAGPGDLLQTSAKDYASLVRRCAAFDATFQADMTRVGGPSYASLTALAYRQCQAACKLVADPNGQPLLLPKENFSNGCIATVDVIFPQAPQQLLFGPTLTKALLAPVLEYAVSSRWRFPFAPHDLGTYPLANGQVYGGGERTERDQMPVEETGNILILLDALAHAEGNADFAGRYWTALGRWADYLKDYGLDPANQLCTDDFAGHLAHNANLSAKAIVALGAYADLCAMHGDKAQAAKYRALAQTDARHWIEAASEGDHSKLAFDQPNTWSQKYNLVWDKILGLNLFPPSIARREMDWYLAHRNKYGLPLDNRRTYTKLDWTTWSATLTASRRDFDALMRPVYDFVNETPDRVPMSDWYETTNAHKVGFQARSVVGGLFLPVLYDGSLWKKWVTMDRAKVGLYAPLPARPQAGRVLVPTAREASASWQYTTDAPANGWQTVGFDASGWKTGQGGFGQGDVGAGVIHTPWTTPDIWLRREFDWPANGPKNPVLLIEHDEDAEVYINGVRAFGGKGFLTDYAPNAISPQALAALKPGRNVLAVHCHQTSGGQYIDVGLAEMKR